MSSIFYIAFLLGFISSVIAENSTSTDTARSSTVASTPSHPISRNETVVFKTLNSTEAAGNLTIATTVAATTIAVVNLTTFKKADEETQCLSVCLLNVVVQSEKIVEHDFERTCRTYHPSCFERCDGHKWQNLAKEASHRCRFNSHFAFRNFHDCYDRHTEESVHRCRGNCGLAEDLKAVFAGDFCSKLPCLMECIRTSLNQHCNGAGDAIERTFYSPYDAIRLNNDIREALERALPELPKSCQGLYTGLGRPARTHIISDKE